MPDKLLRTLRTVLVFALTLVAPPAFAQGGWLTGGPDLSTIDPADICNCTGQSMRGGITSPEQFFETFDWVDYQSDEEALLAWQVFRTVNSCNATIIIGRLDDLADVSGRAGTCMLHDYADWSPAINDAYILGGIERAAPFEAVSPPIGEIELEGEEGGLHRRNIYNRELMLIESEGGYRLSGDIAAASPDRPAQFTPIESWALQLSFDGALAGLEFPAIPFDVAEDGRVDSRDGDAVGEMVLEGRVGGRDADLYLIARGWDDDVGGMVEVFNLSLVGEISGGRLTGTFDGRMADFECAMEGLFEDEAESCGTLGVTGTWQANSTAP